LALIILSIAVSLYFFFVKKQPDLLPQNVDIILGILGGFILGVTSASSYQSS
jgi:hypothetical protein